MQIEQIPEIKNFLELTQSERKRIISSLFNVLSVSSSSTLSEITKQDFILVLRLMDAIYHNSKN